MRSFLLPLCALLTLSACQGPAPRRVASRDVADDTYLLRLPDGAGQMGRLRSELSRRGLRVQHEYSDLVGLAGTVRVEATPAEVRALLEEVSLPIEAHAAVLRYPDQMMPSCGDGRCDAASEAETGSRTATCSVDCGVPAPASRRDDLENAWHVRLVGADKVWPFSRGEGIHVAVLDTGYDRGPATTHPDRPENLGFGYNFNARSPDYTGLTDHGTHTAGIIAAPRNGVGSVGIAPGATIHPFHVFRRDPNTGSVNAIDADIIVAIETAIRNNYHILNMSLGGGHDSELEHEALRRAYDAGLLPVVSAGNGEDYAMGRVLTAPRHFPGSYPEVLSVGATSIRDTIAGFSATGPTVTVSAPGLNVYSSVIVGTGDREAAVTFSVPGVGDVAMAGAAPGDASTVPLRGVPLVSCGFGSAAEVAACKPLDKVALIQRGPPPPGMAITFREKTENARKNGAIGVVLYNHRGGAAATAGGLFGADLGTGHPIPVVALAAGDGERLVYWLSTKKANEEIKLNLDIATTDYAPQSGTSMSAPVVAGVAALLWSRYRHLTNVQVRQLISETAADLGPPGRDDYFGWGRVDAYRAFQQGAPRSRCGDGRLDRASELCDGAAFAGRTCDDFGWDVVPGMDLACNRTCTAIDASRCGCQDKGTPFEATTDLKANYVFGAEKGTLATYIVKLKGQPVRGAKVHVVVRRNGAVAYEYDLGPSDDEGRIPDFTPYENTGMTPGIYEFTPEIRKGFGRCHPNQPTAPKTYTVDIKS